MFPQVRNKLVEILVYEIDQDCVKPFYMTSGLMLLFTIGTPGVAVIIGIFGSNELAMFGALMIALVATSVLMFLASRLPVWLKPEPEITVVTVQQQPQPRSATMPLTSEGSMTMTPDRWQTECLRALGEVT
jgi:hypothetical protein